MTAEATIHISSAVVSVLPQRRDEVLRALERDGSSLNRLGIPKSEGF
jgi:nitrate reductase NapAB chaperone NapD